VRQIQRAAKVARRARVKFRRVYEPNAHMLNPEFGHDSTTISKN
jgi:hypothetical protein